MFQKEQAIGSLPRYDNAPWLFATALDFVLWGVENNDQLMVDFVMFAPTGPDCMKGDCEEYIKDNHDWMSHTHVVAEEEGTVMPWVCVEKYYYEDTSKDQWTIVFGPAAVTAVVLSCLSTMASKSQTLQTTRQKGKLIVSHCDQAS